MLKLSVGGKWTEIEYTVGGAKVECRRWGGGLN